MRTLHLNGTIAEESWFDDDVTPQLFRDELEAGTGDITIWINSPGGDCVAAAQIYNMLMDYKGSVTVKIDGIAASAASVIAMAGTEVLMSPVGMLMIHNPMTVAMGDAEEMEKAIEMLSSVKDSILNAYEIKTGLSRAKLAHLMDAETWMDANKALELGFIDGILARDTMSQTKETVTVDSDESEEDKSETKDDAPKASMVLSQKNECKCLSCGKTLRKSKYKLERERELRVFIAMIKEKPMLLEEWSDDLWISLIESGTVHRDGSITFLFKNGASIHVTQ